MDGDYGMTTPKEQNNIASATAPELSDGCKHNPEKKNWETPILKRHGDIGIVKNEAGPTEDGTEFTTS
jgi:hypothetical protein